MWEWEDSRRIHSQQNPGILKYVRIKRKFNKMTMRFVCGSGENTKKSKCQNAKKNQSEHKMQTFKQEK